MARRGPPELRRPREGGDPAAHSSERRWVPASAGTTKLCTWSRSSVMRS